MNFIKIEKNKNFHKKLRIVVEFKIENIRNF